MPQHMRHRPVDFRIALTALFVGNVPRITYPGQDKSMLNTRHQLFVLSQPGNRPNRSWNKRKR